MIETNLNIFDMIVLGVMALSTILAFFRGFVREILSLGAWVGAGMVTIYFFPSLAEYLQPKFKNQIVAAGFATLGIYIGALMGFSLINMIILRFVKSGSDVGLLDNWFGMVFGAFRGAFILSLGFFLMSMVLPEDDYPKWIKESYSAPYVEKGAIIVTQYAPKYLRDISPLRLKLKEQQDAAEEAAENPPVKEVSPWMKDAQKRIQNKLQE